MEDNFIIIISCLHFLLIYTFLLQTADTKFEPSSDLCSLTLGYGEGKEREREKERREIDLRLDTINLPICFVVPETCNSIYRFTNILLIHVE